MNNTAAEPRKKKFLPEIHTGVFVWFISFSALILLLLWTLQIFFLNDIYLYATRSRMQNTAESIAEMQERGGLTEAELRLLVEDYRYSVSLHRIDRTDVAVHPRKLLSVSFSGAIADGISPSDYYLLLNHLYRDTAKSPDKMIFFDVRPDENAPTDDFSSRILCARHAVINNVEYLTVIDAELVPTAPMVSLLRFLLTVFTVLFFLVALLIAFLASRSISAPLVRISNAAKELPAGRFTTPEKVPYREIGELSDTLSDVAEELRRSERFQNELIANVSHDLRTPLTTVIGYSEVMRDFAAERTPENCQLVIDEARRLTDFVQDILTLSRIQAGDSARHTEVFDLDALLCETVERYRRLKGVSGFDFSYDSMGDAPVSADKTELSQVICNLLNNAVNYSGDARRIEIALKKADGTVTVSVRDFGIGIPKSELPRIFDRYYKVDKTHERARIGSGIGLSIVKRVLEGYAADYGAESELGEGSLFWFRLPLAADGAAALPKKACDL